MATLETQIETADPAVQLIQVYQAADHLTDEYNDYVDPPEGIGDSVLDLLEGYRYMGVEPQALTDPQLRNVGSEAVKAHLADLDYQAGLEELNTRRLETYSALHSFMKGLVGEKVEVSKLKGGDSRAILHRGWRGSDPKRHLPKSVDHAEGLIVKGASRYGFYIVPERRLGRLASRGHFVTPLNRRGEPQVAITFRS